MTAVANASRSITVFFLLLGLGFGFLTVPSVQAQTDLAVYEIEGNVQNATGALNGAEVTLVRQADRVAVANATTDASGNYRFSLVRAGDYIVSAAHDCCSRASVEVSVGGTSVKATAPALVLENKQAVMGDPVRLSGIVERTSDGAPVAGVRLEIDSYWSGAEDDVCEGGGCKPYYGGAQYFSTETDGAGRFEIDVNRGSASLRANLKGYDVTHGSLEMSADQNLTVPIRPAEARTVVLQGILKSSDGSALGGGYISAFIQESESCGPGMVCVSPSPAPGSGSGAWSFSSSQPMYNSTQSGSDGSWKLEMTAGRVRVVGSAEEHLEAIRIVEAQEGGNETVDLVLERVPPDSVTVTGRVTDRDTGKPVSGVQVSAENQKWGSWSDAVTDEDGRYELKTKPGYTILTVQFYGIMCMAAEDEPDSDGPESAQTSIAAPCRQAEDSKEYLPATTFFIAEADSDVAKDFALRARPSAENQFEGYVLNSTSKEAIEGAVVTFYNELTHDWGSATTDADGSYRIRVHAGYYSIRVWSEGFFDGVANAEINEGETQRLDLELVPGQKRYGYWAYGGYDVAVREASMDSSGPTAPKSEGAPMPAEGQNVYEGEAGGLGPYKAASEGGSSPSPAFAVLIGLALACLWARRRA